MRRTIAVFLLASAACGSSPSEMMETMMTTGSTSASMDISTGVSAETSSSSSGVDTTSGDATTIGSSDSTGSSNPDLPDPDPDPPQASDYCESIVDSFCAFYLRCGRMDVQSEEACVEPFLESCNAVFEPQYVALEAAGLLTLSTEGLLACEEHLGAVACEEQIFELSGPCSGLWSGTQEAGQSCGLDVEFYVCDDAAACTIGLDFCGTCESLVALGDDCSAEGTTCGPEAFCDEGSCRGRVVNGDACAPDDRCMAGSACVEDVCQGPSFVGNGDACDSARRCPYLTACIDGTCQPTARLGDPCSAGVPCEAGFCDAGTCAPPRDDGASCPGNAACTSGLCGEGTCQPRPSACITD